MSALTTLFSSLANKIRSKTGGSDTYTPPEMVDAIDDVYDAGVASATTPITPSNASPASMTSGTGYKPTANGYAISSYTSVLPQDHPGAVSQNDMVKISGTNGYVIKRYNIITPSNSSPARLRADDILAEFANDGYAIESYDSVTPSSTPTSVSSGDVVKIGGSGVIVDAVPTPTSITPSNSSPVALTANTPVNPTASGYAIESYDSVTPSSTIKYISSNKIIKFNSEGYIISGYESVYPTTPTSVVPLLSGGIYQPSPNCYAILTYSEKTPSASGASFGSGFVKMSSNGFAYSEKQPNFLAPDVTKIIASSSGGTTNITVTQKPRYIVLATWNASGSLFGGELAVIDVTNETAKRMGYGTNGAISWGDWSGYTSYFTSITSSSVTYKSAWSSNACRSMILIYY